MPLLERIADMLGGLNGEIVHRNADEITEIRLRADRPVYIDLLGGSDVKGEFIDGQTLHNILNALMDNSMYSRENELKQGYFTTSEGFRVGVCGKVNAGKYGIEQLANIGSACIRIPREVLGCARQIYEIAQNSARYSLLIVSPPGMGKTTLLRDYIRFLSDGGMNIGLADERREIACCLDGIPQLDVGDRTDVMDGCPKYLGLSMMIRACAPDLVAADEIGSVEEAQALIDAKRCGVHIAVSAHGLDLNDVRRRPYVGMLLAEKVFDWCVLLGPGRGQVREIISLYNNTDEELYDVQRFAADVDIVGLYLPGQDAFECAKAKMRNSE